jgi:hypothetical protein
MEDHDRGRGLRQRHGQRQRRPINDKDKDKDPSAHGWLGAAEVAVLTVSEFRRRVEKEQAQ